MAKTISGKQRVAVVAVSQEQGISIMYIFSRMIRQMKRYERTS